MTIACRHILTKLMKSATAQRVKHNPAGQRFTPVG